MLASRVGRATLAQLVASWGGAGRNCRKPFAACGLIGRFRSTEAASTNAQVSSASSRAKLRAAVEEREGRTFAGDEWDEVVLELLQRDHEFLHRAALLANGKQAKATAEAETVDAADVGADLVTSDMLVAPPTALQLLKLGVRVAVPFVGFGFFDNMIMLTVGGAIESNFGLTLGISSLAAAGMGQMVSDACGITLQGLIERFADMLRLPQPHMTLGQLAKSAVKTFILFARIFGIVLGCAIGMFPVLLIPGKEEHLVDRIAEKIAPQFRREFISRVQTQRFEEGEVIIACGELSDSVFMIRDGEVDIIGRNSRFMPFRVCTLGPGQVFGKPNLQIHAHVDLIAKTPVTLQRISKDDFMRFTGQAGTEVWEEAQSGEHRVYLATRRSFYEEAPAPLRGSGKTRLFASLTDEEKLEVLKLSRAAGSRKFAGRQGEGKVRFFALLTEDQKHNSLQKWFNMKKQSD